MKESLNLQLLTGHALYQFHPQVHSRDGIGNEIRRLHRLFLDAGRKTGMYSLAGQAADSVQPIASLRSTPDDLLLVHYSHSPSGYNLIWGQAARKILVYHNVTPPEYLEGLEPHIAAGARAGRQSLPVFAHLVQGALAHSNFSARDLERAGYEPITVLPYLLDENLLNELADQALFAQIQQEGPNLLTVGRIAPHKCLEDAILAFHYLKRIRRPKSRLWIAGAWTGMEAYKRRLDDLIADLALADVFFLGAISQNEMTACYQAANLFLQMSEHEGFGIPVLEAIYHQVPVIAYAGGATTEILGPSGVLCPIKNPSAIGEACDLILEQDAIRQQLIDIQNRRFRQFEPGQVSAQWLNFCEISLP